MPKIHNVDQKSDEWFNLRAGKATASEFKEFITPKFAIRTGEMPATYIASKAAERWIGRPLPEDNWSTRATEFGSIIESFARPTFELLSEKEVTTVGLITTDDDLAACSPDGLIGDDCGIEIKCPEHTKHTKNVIGGVLPEDHVIQVQFSMFVSSRPTWYFMSFRSDMPPLIVLVHRDDKAQAVIKQAVAEFGERVDEAFNKLVAANGGKTPVRHKTVAEVLAEESDDGGVTP